MVGKQSIGRRRAGVKRIGATLRDADALNPLMGRGST
jgi:hypothetical protein